MYNSNPKNYNKKNGLYEKQEISRVLLVCVYDTIALQVTNQLIYERFSKFGSIVKVLIFEKGEVTKLFIEFYEIPSAQQAKNALDGTKLLGAICKMNIYYSNFSNVDLKNETSQGQDFTEHQTLKNEYMSKFDNLAKSFQGEPSELLNDEYLMNAAFYQYGNRSKTDNPKRLQEQINMINMKTTNNLYYNPLSMMISENEEFDMIIHQNINNLLQTNSNASSDIKNQIHTHSTNSSNERINPALKIKDASPAKSSVICFQLRKDVKVKCVYNLFSNFGNISFISKKAKKLYIKFRSMEFAAIAFTYLNQYFFMGNLLKLQYPQSPNEAFPKEQEFSECLFYDETTDRYTPNRSLTVNSPSLTLHVSSIKKDICKEHVLYDIFGEYGKVQAVKILCYSNQKNMALVKFYSMEDSFEAIANLHNQMFSNRKMQISFTKSKV